jgi:hypothetical protein
MTLLDTLDPLQIPVSLFLSFLFCSFTLLFPLRDSFLYRQHQK